MIGPSSTKNAVLPAMHKAGDEVVVLHYGSATLEPLAARAPPYRRGLDFIDKGHPLGVGIKSAIEPVRPAQLNHFKLEFFEPISRLGGAQSDEGLEIFGRPEGVYFESKTRKACRSRTSVARPRSGRRPISIGRRNMTICCRWRCGGQSSLRMRTPMVRGEDPIRHHAQRAFRQRMMVHTPRIQNFRQSPTNCSTVKSSTACRGKNIIEARRVLLQHRALAPIALL